MKYDLIVIGSGPGGYVAAIRAAQLGMNTAIVERYDTLGGTCLNVGCIPSKALLDSTEHVHKAREEFSEHGIQLGDVEVDMEQMIARKAGVVEDNVKGIAFLMKKNKVDVYHGHASFEDRHNITIARDDKENEQLESEHFIIATGSKPNTPEAFNYDKKRVITSTEALEVEKIPKKMIVVGGGIIGLEMGSVYARLGTEVHVVEYMDQLLATMDRDCGKTLQKSLEKLGIEFYLSHEVRGVEALKTKVKVEVQKRDSEDDSFQLDGKYCLVAIGRRAYTKDLGLERISVETDDRGKIEVDEHLRTGEQNIFAIGDVIKGPMLAHKAEDEGVYVAEFLDGQKPHIDYNLIPGVVYTWPEVASVGHSEEELNEEGVEYKKGKFPYKALGRARASMDTDGMVKILSDRTTDEVLGVHMVGARAADMIAEAVAVMEYRGSAEDIARICHAHPTYTEATKEAALAATDDRAIHI